MERWQVVDLRSLSDSVSVTPRPSLNTTINFSSPNEYVRIDRILLPCSLSIRNLHLLFLIIRGHALESNELYNYLEETKLINVGIYFRYSSKDLHISSLEVAYHWKHINNNSLAYNDVAQSCRDEETSQRIEEHVGIIMIGRVLKLSSDIIG